MIQRRGWATPSPAPLLNSAEYSGPQPSLWSRQSTQTHPGPDDLVPLPRMEEPMAAVDSLFANVRPTRLGSYLIEVGGDRRELV
jgi:hypothetical protein